MKAPISKETRKENRKINHSLIEKKRRNKMNECLQQLSQLVPACARMENIHKLDVLEMTVQYILEMKNKSFNSLNNYNNPPPTPPRFHKSHGRVDVSSPNRSAIPHLCSSTRSMTSPKSEYETMNIVSNKMNIRNLLC